MKYLLLLLLVGCSVQTEFFDCSRQSCFDILSNLITNNSKCAIYTVSKDKMNIFNDNLITHTGKGPLMHNKFCVLNSTSVITGSYNFHNTSKRDVMLLLHSKKISNNYLNQYYFLKNNSYLPKIDNKVLNVENYFCPKDPCDLIVLDKLQNAKKRVYFEAYSFTDFKLAHELIKLHSKGIVVRGLMDSSQISMYSQYDTLYNQGLNVRKVKNLHTKIFVIDNYVILGSYNPTNNGARRNDENIVIVKDKLLAEKILEQ